MAFSLTCYDMNREHPGAKTQPTLTFWPLTSPHQVKVESLNEALPAVGEVKRCCLHPDRLLPTGRSSICLWTWQTIKAGGDPQRQPHPLMLTAWKTVELAAAAVDAHVLIRISRSKSWAEARKRGARACVQALPSAAAAAALWITIKNIWSECLLLSSSWLCLLHRC